MSSIFDVSFINNVSRINRATDGSCAKSEHRTKFAKILADFENSSDNTDNLNKTGALDASKYGNSPINDSSDIQVSYLTNLDHKSINTLNAKQINKTYGENIDGETSQDSVNIPLKPVKMIAINIPKESLYGKMSSQKLNIEQGDISINNNANLESTTSKKTLSIDVPPVRSPIGLKSNSNVEIINSDIATEMKSIISLAGKLHGVDPFLGIAVAQSESSFSPTAVSNDGFDSKGLFQLLDTTAKDMMERLDFKENYKPFDPKVNSHLGIGYLRYLLGIFSDGAFVNQNLKAISAKSALDLEKLAVAAFNAGEGAVARAQNQARELGLDGGEFAAIERFLPKITRSYVQRVSNTKTSLEHNITQ